MTIVVSKKGLNSIVDALLEAIEHLEYCGYGDAWESELARDGGMIARMDIARDLATIMVGKS